MDQPATMLVVLGAVLLLGLLTDTLGERTRLPRVTLLLLFGVALGPLLRGLSADDEVRWFPQLAQVALSMVGFLLGERVSPDRLRERGRLVLGFSISAVLVTAVLVFFGLSALGYPTQLALVLAAIATATAPAASVAVVQEVGARGLFSDTLLGIVALDDAWGLVVFSILLATAVALGGDGAPLTVLFEGGRELGGALVLGLVLGVPAAYLTGRVKRGEPMLVEALGLVLLCSGIAQWLGVSSLLAAMVLGAVVATLARHHTRPFHAIERIEWPFLILFFVFAGASLRLEALPSIGVLGLAYVVLRAAGRVLGAWAAGLLLVTPPEIRRWMGLALMPQAGVALGMALIVQQRIPDLGVVVLPVVISATVLFEIVGPVLTRFALLRTELQGEPES